MSDTSVFSPHTLERLHTTPPSTLLTYQPGSTTSVHQSFVPEPYTSYGHPPSSQFLIFAQSWPEIHPKTAPHYQHNPWKIIHSIVQRPIKQMHLCWQWQWVWPIPLRTEQLPATWKTCSTRTQMTDRLHHIRTMHYLHQTNIPFKSPSASMALSGPTL